MHIRQIKKEITVDVVKCENIECDNIVEGPVSNSTVLPQGSKWIHIRLLEPRDVLEPDWKSHMYFCTWTCMHRWALSNAERLENDPRLGLNDDSSS